MLTRDLFAVANLLAIIKFWRHTVHISDYILNTANPLVVPFLLVSFPDIWRTNNKHTLFTCRIQKIRYDTISVTVYICPPIFSLMCIIQIISSAGVARALCMWSPLMQAGSGNLALLHCSCLHTCLAAYSSILRRDLNTTCININRSVWRHGRGRIREGLIDIWGFWSKPSVKVEIKTTWEVVSTCRVLWSAWLNTSKVTANRQEDRSCQWEVTKKSVGLR